MCLGKGVTPFFFYLFFFTCIRGTSRDLMGRFFCPIGVQRCIASRFSTTSQARLISYQILLLNYFPPSNGHPRPFSPGGRVVSVLSSRVSIPNGHPRPFSLFNICSR